MSEFERSSPYEIIGRAIDFMDQNAASLTKIDDVASQLKISTMHFKRIFAQWIGVASQKDYQYLTLSFVKRLIKDRFILLNTEKGLGFSETCQSNEVALNLGSIQTGSSNDNIGVFTIHWGIFDSPFGEVLAVGTRLGICGLAFVNDIGYIKALKDMQKRWPLAHYVKNSDLLEEWVAAAFNPNLKTRVYLTGGPFQLKVWEALLNIPSGYVTTYSEIAECIGYPKAVRAVGTAVGQNPVSWVIPCHRVLRKSGKLGGYRWGLRTKRFMLAYESARLDSGICEKKLRVSSKTT